jgi:lysyl-tRNA synthetase class 2
MPSTVIRALAYRPDRRELELLFTTGRRYIYHDVPPPVGEAFRTARIKGRHFNAHIRGRYAFTEIEKEADEDAAGPRRKEASA